jgi:hypothetical protein
MARCNLSTLALLALAFPIASPAVAQAPAASAAASTVDPAALEALRGMGAYLKTLTNFELRSNGTLSTSAADTDLKVSLGLQNTYRVQRPNRLFVEIRSDKQFRQYFYDGKSFTVYVPRTNSYAHVPAAATIGQLVGDLNKTYDIQLPLSDLFNWAIEGAPTEGIKSAKRVGHAKVGNIETDAYLYSDDTIDFELWISSGAKPLPIKLVLTARDDPGRTSYSAEFTWNTSPSFPADTFVFKPKPPASEGQFAQVAHLEQ